MKEVLDMYKEKTSKTFNETANNYNNSPAGKFSSRIYDEVIGIILKEKPKNLLDLGCGNGNILNALFDKKIECKLSGVDLSSEMIKESRRRLDKTITLKEGDAEEIPWDDHTFDCVLCSMSFHHYIRPEQVLSEIKRVLKPNGLFILGDPTMEIELMRIVYNVFSRWSKEGDYHLYSQKEMQYLLEKYGFKVCGYVRPAKHSFVIMGRLK